MSLLPEFVMHAYDVESDAPVIVLGGELDLRTAPQLAMLSARLVPKAPKMLTLDLSHVTFLSISAMHVIAGARAQLPVNCEVILRKPRGIVRLALELAGMDRLCTIED